MENAITLSAGMAFLVYLVLMLPRGEINALCGATVITQKLALLLAAICFVIVMAVYTPRFLEAQRVTEANRYAYTCRQCGRSYAENDPDGASGVGGICSACVDEMGQQFFDSVQQKANPDTSNP